MSRIHRNAISAALVLPLLFCGPTLRAQRSSETAAEVSFAFERAGLPVPRFILTVDQNGRGTYKGDQTEPGVRSVLAQPATVAFEQKFELSSQTTRRIFALAGELDHFNIACASKAKNVADSGTKTLTYAAPGTTNSCTYNYTENKSVAALTDLFQGLPRRWTMAARWTTCIVTTASASTTSWRASPVRSPPATPSSCKPSRQPCVRLHRTRT